MPQDLAQDSAQAQPITKTPAQPAQLPTTPIQPAPATLQTPQSPTEPAIIHTQPQADQATPPPPPQNLYPRSTRKIFLSIAFVFFILSAITLGGALTLAYKNYPVISPPTPVKKALDNILAISPLPKPTRLIIESSFAKTALIKSADVKTELSLTTDSSSSLVESFKLTMAGPSQFENPKSQASEFDIGFDIKMEGASFNGSASVKTVNDRIYFMVNEIPFGQFYSQLLDYRGKWYYWDIPEDYKNQPEREAAWGDIDEIISTFVKKSQAWTTLVSKDGEVYELEVKPPKQEIVNLVYDVIQAYEPQDQGQLSTDLEKEEISKALEKLNDLKITMKINKDDYLLKSIAAQFSLVIDDISLPNQSISYLPQKQTVLNFNLIAELSNYNKMVVIAPPENAINVETAVKEIEASLGQNLIPSEFALPTEPSPEKLPESLPDELLPQATEEGDLEDDVLHDLISPEETILGEKYNWEQELFKLFSKVFN